MTLFLVLRVAAAMCFIGHAAFSIMTKAPIIGVVDILLGLSMLIRPTSWLHPAAAGSRP